MDSLLNDAFLLSKLEKGDGLFPLENVDISEQLNWAINTVSANTVSKEIDIHLINDQPCVVGGNTVAIRQVLINLLSNAVKYNRKNGNIWIYTNNISNGIEVSVKDTGYGIFEDELPKIFEKFFRAKGSERAQGDRTGPLYCRIAYGCNGRQYLGKKQRGSRKHLYSIVQKGSTVTKS